MTSKTVHSKLSLLATMLISFTLIIVLTSSCAPKFECRDAIGCVDIAPGKPIKVGIMQALSGSVSPSGTRYSRSVEMALDAIGGTIHDHPVELVRADSQCSKEGGITAGLQIVADPQIIGVIGTTCSSEARGAMAYLSDAGLVMISGSNTSPSLTAANQVKGEDFHPGYFRTAHNDADQGLAAATFAFQELGKSKAAVIVVAADSYSQGLGNVFEQAFADLSGEMVYSGEINKGDEDMKPILEAIVNSGAEFLFFPVFQPEGDLIVLQSKEVSGFENIILMSADSLLLGSFVESVMDAGVGTFYIVPDKPSGEEYDAFVDAYIAKYNEELTTNFHAHTYDAATILLKAIEAVAVKDSDGTLHIGRQALRDYLYNLQGFEGLIGAISCNEFGDCGLAKFRVVRFDDPSVGVDGIKSNIVYLYSTEK